MTKLLVAIHQSYRKDSMKVKVARRVRHEQSASLAGPPIKEFVSSSYAREAHSTLEMMREVY